MVGAHSEFFVIDTAQQHFRRRRNTSNQAVPFRSSIRPPASCATRWYRLRTCGAAWRHNCGERLLERRHSARLTFLVLEQVLLAQAAQRLNAATPQWPSSALREFHGLPHTRTIAEVTGQIGLSAKRFIQVFSGEVGLTPEAVLPRPS